MGGILEVVTSRAILKSKPLNSLQYSENQLPKACQICIKNCCGRMDEGLEQWAAEREGLKRAADRKLGDLARRAARQLQESQTEAEAKLEAALAKADSTSTEEDRCGVQSPGLEA